jgi:sugar phosphate isomerase/epimerase
MRADQLGLQMYTVREPASRDFFATLRSVAAMGYRALELAGLYGHPAASVRAALDEYGLRAVAAHVPYGELSAHPAAVAAELHTLGCSYAVVPWVGEEHRNSAEAVRAFAADLNRIGLGLRKEGLQLAYHHHNFEFAPLEGSSMWEIFTPALDPAVVGLEIDVYWAQRAGRDPAELITRHAQATTLIHLKDIEPGGEADWPAGAGALDWESILAAARAADAAWYFVEQDNPADPLEDVRRARELMLARALA